ncbi:MAG: hypothetical protein ACOVT5_10655 [Armatimonadaceae bacterium]
MSSFVITCPNPLCGKPLNLPAAVLGQPLRCPHCETGIGVARGPDGKPTTPVAVKTGRVPKMFLVPGFALLILGAGGLFANGYIACQAVFEPGGSVKFSRLMLDYLRNADEAGTPAQQAKGKPDDPREAFAAVMGTAVGAAEKEEIDRLRAEERAKWVGPVFVLSTLASLLTAGGGLAILLGRWYWLAMVGSVAAILNGGLCCCVPGLVAGLWGVLMLVRDDGRRHFAR